MLFPGASLLQMMDFYLFIYFLFLPDQNSLYMYWPESISFKLTPEEDKAETHAKEIRTEAAVVAVLSKVAGIFTLKEGHGTRALLIVVYEFPRPSWHITAGYRFVNMSNVTLCKIYTSKKYVYSIYIINFFFIF